jgi:hypothetical protein
MTGSTTYHQDGLGRKSADTPSTAGRDRAQAHPARDAELAPLTTALDNARMTSKACTAFQDQEETEQLKLLTMVLKESTWQDAGLRITLVEPFEQRRRSNQLSNTKNDGNDGSGMDLKI